MVGSSTKKRGKMEWGILTTKKKMHRRLVQEKEMKERGEWTDTDRGGCSLFVVWASLRQYSVAPPGSMVATQERHSERYSPACVFLLSPFPLVQIRVNLCSSVDEFLLRLLNIPLIFCINRLGTG
jgi:hypothetical protein